MNSWFSLVLEELKIYNSKAKIQLVIIKVSKNIGSLILLKNK